ncbi:MAG: carbon starvation CstA family protein [bacterium]
MNITVILGIAAACLLIAYFLYGSFLARMFRLDRRAKTPAVEMRDDVDYVPIEPKFLLGQHFSAIAAAGPIVGPIVAGVRMGWLPAILWIIVGSIFIGGVHDMTTLIASVRHKARSITELVREYMSRRAFIIFLIFIWVTLVYIIVVFTDITASSFVGMVKLDNGEEVKGGAIAASSLIYLGLPIVMGLLMRYAKLSLFAATVIFLPLVGVAIWCGKFIPFSLDDIVLRLGLASDPSQAVSVAIKMWDVMLLVYCYIASLVPMWLLLQPRGYLGGFFLYIVLIGGTLGLILSGESVKYPAVIAGSPDPVFPMLFILIACGACSGFHAIVSSGTTCKQLRYETDAKIIGYGAMLLEAFVAVISLCCVIILAKESALVQKSPNFIYAAGIGRFLETFGVPASFGISFGLLAFTTFVYDTLDVCTRLGRYIIEELTGLRGRWGRLAANLITAAAPLFFVMRTMIDPATGKSSPAWKYFWSLFGASNQLLAAIALLCVTVWIVRTFKVKIIAVVTALPTTFMYVTSIWALMRLITKSFTKEGIFTINADPVPWVAVFLILLSLIMLIEALISFIKPVKGNKT